MFYFGRVQDGVDQLFQPGPRYPGRFLFPHDIGSWAYARGSEDVQGYLPEGHQLVEQEYREPKAEAKAA
jgi:hypothetical protein